MSKPWELAVKTMRDFFATKDQEWPADEAGRLLLRIQPGRNHRWVDRNHARQAEDILRRSVFDVDDLLENHLGIRICIERLDHLDKSQGAPVFGCAYPRKREVLVCERALGYDPLYRTTLLHEAGHVLLHSDEANRCMLYVPRERQSSPEEREANEFMEVAILPKQVLCLGVAYLCDFWGIDIRRAIRGANNEWGRWVWRHRILGPLVSQLCVSREMNCIKMRRLKAFSPDTVKYHLSYSLATKWHNPEHCDKPAEFGAQQQQDARLTRFETPAG